MKNGKFGLQPPGFFLTNKKLTIPPGTKFLDFLGLG